MPAKKKSSSKKSSGSTRKSSSSRKTNSRSSSSSRKGSSSRKKTSSSKSGRKSSSSSKKSSGRKYGPKAQREVRTEMHHMKKGKHPVKNRKQAIAIGLSKARRKGAKVPPRPKSSRKAA